MTPFAELPEWPTATTHVFAIAPAVALAMVALALGCQSVEQATGGVACRGDSDCKRSERCAIDRGRCVLISGDAASDGSSPVRSALRDLGIGDALTRRDSGPDATAHPPPDAALPVPADATPVDGAPDTAAAPRLDASEPGPRQIGAACERDHDCPGDECLYGQEFPGGYCSSACEYLGCPSGTRCLELDTEADYYCLKLCETNDECRTGDGYICDRGLCLGQL